MLTLSAAALVAASSASLMQLSARPWLYSLSNKYKANITLAYGQLQQLQLFFPDNSLSHLSSSLLIVLRVNHQKVNSL